MTKKIFLVFTLLCSTIYSMGQSTENKLSALQQQVEKLQQQVAGISQRLSEVEQLNIDLRKALDFGKPVTTAQGANGVTYKILNIEGNKADMSFSFGEPTFVDLYGNRQKADAYSIGGETVCPVYKGTPVNGLLVFKDVDPEKAKELKMIEIHGQNNFQEERVFLRDLKVDWK